MLMLGYRYGWGGAKGAELVKGLREQSRRLEGTVLVGEVEGPKLAGEVEGLDLFGEIEGLDLFWGG